jgi:hypothetical protein
LVRAFTLSLLTLKARSGFLLWKEVKEFQKDNDGLTMIEIKVIFDLLYYSNPGVNGTSSRKISRKSTLQIKVLSITEKDMFVRKIEE